MKKFLCTLFALFTCYSLFAYSTFWADPITGVETESGVGIEWKYVDNGNNRITIGSGSYSTPAVLNTTEGDIVIPSKVGDKNVTAIGDGAFWCCGQITSITVPEGVTYLGYHAFQGAERVKTITLPESITSISQFTFQNCTGLESIKIPSKVHSIPRWAFIGCQSLKSITIPAGVTSIYQQAFQDCTSLETVTILGPISDMYDGVFKRCHNLINVEILSDMTLIGDEMFYGCSKLKSISLPKSIKSIGRSAFDGCSDLDVVDISANVTTIGERAFSGTNGVKVNSGNSVYASDANGVLFSKSGTLLIQSPRCLKSYTVPDGVVTIADSAFEGCNLLTDVKISDSVVSIGSSAFKNCTSLSHITVSTNIETIKAEAFAGTSAKEVYYLGKKVDEVTKHFNNDSVIFHVSPLFRGEWDGMKNIIVDDLVETFTTEEGLEIAISSNEAYVVGAISSTLDRLEIPSQVMIGPSQKVYSVVDISYDAFANQKGLHSVTLPSSVGRVRSGAFLGCSALEYLSFSPTTQFDKDSLKGVTPITLRSTRIPLEGSVALERLDKIIIPSGAETVNITSLIKTDSAFYEVEPGNPAFVSRDGALYNHDGTVLIRLAGKTLSYSVPEDVTTIGDFAFYGMSTLTELTVPDTVVEIGKGAFARCENLLKFYVSSTVQSRLTREQFEMGSDTNGQVLSVNFGRTAVSSSSESLGIIEGVPGIFWNDLLDRSGRGSAFKIFDVNGTLEVSNSLKIEYSSDTVWSGGFNSLLLNDFLDGNTTSAPIRVSVRNIPWETYDLLLYTPKGGSSAVCPSVNGVFYFPEPDGAIRESSIGGRYNASVNPEVIYSYGKNVLRIPGLHSANLQIIIDTRGKGMGSLAALQIIQSFSQRKNTLPFYLGTYDTETCVFSLLSELKKIPAWAFRGQTKVKRVICPESLTTIESGAFESCKSLESIEIPQAVVSIESRAFSGCTALKQVALPVGLTTLGDYCFSDCTTLSDIVISEGCSVVLPSRMLARCMTLAEVIVPASIAEMSPETFDGYYGRIVFAGSPPKGFEISDLGWREDVIHPDGNATEWKHALQVSRFHSGIDSISRAKVKVRMADPKTMEITYRITSNLPKVQVRAVAFRDGVRSFANVVLMKTGTGIPDGTTWIETNKDYTFTWNVASDWTTELDKVAVDILIREDALLPMDCYTVPANGETGAKTVSVHRVTQAEAFNAILWCVVEGDPDLSVRNGSVYHNGAVVAQGGAIGHYQTDAALNYLYGKMGYRVLRGTEYDYVKGMTRLNLATSGLGQAAVKDGAFEDKE